MDKNYEELLAKVHELDRDGKAEVLDYLCISIVDEGWRYHVRGKANEEVILATLALDLESRVALRDKLMAERDPEIEQYWIEESRRRIEALERGEETTVSGEEALERVRRMIEEYKVKL